MGQPDKATIILVSTLCPSCEALELKFKEQIASGVISLVDIASDEGVRLVKDLDIRAVPEIIGIEVKDDKRTVCRLNLDLEPMQCVESAVTPSEPPAAEPQAET